MGLKEEQKTSPQIGKIALSNDADLLAALADSRTGRKTLIATGAAVRGHARKASGRLAKEGRGTSRVLKWGNSSAVRLSTRVLAASGITALSEVNITAQDGKIIIEPIQDNTNQALEALLEATPGMADLLKEVNVALDASILKTAAAIVEVESAEKLLQEHSL